MSYRVLARAYRSNTFDEVVGQDAIATTLKNAIAAGRVHHGYLFTGTRGVGKTSMARILAKSLNCLAADGPTATPCLKCDSCLAVATGDDIDVVEIDAASNTGVDNIRELRSNASLRPARSRFKIYIIDEVHMLSTGAFNALLKTLEEPPPHIKFILATTELHKVPATIQSRVQRFDFRAIDSAAIAAHLKNILAAEGIEAEEAALKRIARLGNGSMRDALSILDKVLSFDETKVTTAVIEELLPPPHDELAFAVMEAVAGNDAGAALKAVDAALQTGRTVDRFVEHLIEHIRTLMMMRLCGPQTDIVDVPDAMRPALAEQAGKFDAPTYVYMTALLEELRRSARFSGAARALCDAAVVRLAMSRQFTDIKTILDQLGSGGGANAPAAATAGGPDAAKKKELMGSGTGGAGIGGTNIGGPGIGATGIGGAGIGGTAVSAVPGSGGTAVSAVRQDATGIGGTGVPADQDSTNVPPRIGADRTAETAVPPRQTAETAIPPATAPTPVAPSSRPGGERSGQTGAISSAVWQKVAADPLVRKVRDAVEGTLFDVRPPAGPIEAPPAPGEDGEEPAEEADASEASKAGDKG